MTKPTIEELERLLDGTDSPKIQIMPNGEVKLACENCLKLQERIVGLESALQQKDSADICKCSACGREYDGDMWTCWRCSGRNS